MEAWQLKQRQSLPLEAKINHSLSVIRQWYEHWDGQVYVSFSGGKDSTVLLHLVRSIYPEVPAVFVDTGLEFPEIKDFVSTFENVETKRPKLSFVQVLERYGYPVISKQVADNVHLARQNIKDGKITFRVKKMQGTLVDKYGNKSIYNTSKWAHLLDAPFKISDHCCYVMKKSPAKSYEKESGRKPYTGMLACESMLRRTSYLLAGGCNTFEGGKAKSNPLSIWLEQDILEYLKMYSLPIASVYGEIIETKDGLRLTGYERTGCMFCGFGAHLEKGENRFQRMKKTHPEIHAYCMKQLGMKEVLEYIGVKYE